jgi:hypothetical protein
MLLSIVRRGLVLVGFAHTTDDKVSAQRAIDEAHSLLRSAREMHGHAAFKLPDARVARAIDFLTRALDRA